MKIKTSDLSFNQLCYAANIIKNPSLVWGTDIGYHWASYQVTIPKLKEPECYSPLMGGDLLVDLIEKEGFEIECLRPTNRAHADISMRGSWTAKHISESTVKKAPAKGQSMAEAVIRAYVFKYLGDSVEIPEELASGG